MASALRICYSTTCAAHWIAADKSKTKEADREFIKYGFFHALHNAGVSAQYMNTARAGLSKALNTAAHWAPRIVNQVDVHGTGILYKFDIRDYWGYSLIDTSASDFTLFPGLSDDDMAFAPKKVDINGNVVKYASEAASLKCGFR